MVRFFVPMTHPDNLMLAGPEGGPQAKFSLEHGVAITRLAVNPTVADRTGAARETA